MKILLLLFVSGISNGSNTEFQYKMEKPYSTLELCVQASIIMRKVLRAEDNLQARETDVYAKCEVNKDNLTHSEYRQAQQKIRRLEKFYTTEKW
jgi:hypothetical protein